MFNTASYHLWDFSMFFFVNMIQFIYCPRIRSGTTHPPKKCKIPFMGVKSDEGIYVFFWVHSWGWCSSPFAKTVWPKIILRSLSTRKHPPKTPKKPHSQNPQLMVNCWFGSRWFGILWGTPKNPNPFHFRGFQESKPPNAPNQQLTLKPFHLRNKKTAVSNPRRSNGMKFWKWPASTCPSTEVPWPPASTSWRKPNKNNP